MENLIIGLIGIASIWYVYKYYTKKDANGNSNACNTCKGCSHFNSCTLKH
ncbi:MULTISPECIES: FeoB-associated Cys-rich membrane protein [unclassified Lebetimonas]|nr:MULTISPECIES: FeoB-associated Cys-rich membrane protein [unclassified Lebetimonas]